MKSVFRIYGNSAECGIAVTAPGARTCFAIEDEEVTVLEHYGNSGKVAFSYKKRKGNSGITAFAGLGSLTADAKIYLQEDGCYVDLFDAKREYISQNGVLDIGYNNCRAKLLVRK